MLSPAVVTHHLDTPAQDVPRQMFVAALAHAGATPYALPRHHPGDIALSDGSYTFPYSPAAIFPVLGAVAVLSVRRVR